MTNETMPRKEAIQVRTLSEAVLQRWIAQLFQGRGNAGNSAGSTAPGGRFTALHEAIKDRDDAFHANKAPVFLPPFDKMQTFQSDVIRRSHQELMTRIVEHPIRVRVKPPRETIPQRDAAAKLSVVLQTGIELAEERQGISILGLLGDSQLRHCFGVLHWYRRKDVYPEYPEPDELDDLPTDAEEAKRYRKVNAADRRAERKPTGKYRETEAAVKERDQRARALAGFSYGFKCFRPDQVAFVEDEGCENGFGMFFTMETIGKLDYDLDVQKEGYTLSVFEDNPRIHLYQEPAAPERGEPSSTADAWGKQMRLCRVWTRDACYELAAYELGQFYLMRSWPHDHEMPPFALAKAIELNEPDPVKRFHPFLIGLYRTKPDYDYERSLGRILAEQTAIPRYWIEMAVGGYRVDARGNRLVLSEDSALAMTLEPGEKLVKADLTVDPAFVAFLQMSAEDVSAATPDTGRVDVSATTAPHTLNMAQAQSNAPIAFLKQQQLLCIRTALRNIAKTESKSGEALVVMAKVEQGTIKADTVVSVEAREIPGLDIDVSINTKSGAQEVSDAEFYRTLLNDEKVPFGQREYLEKLGVEDVDGAIEQDIAQRAEFQATESMVQQELARRFGGSFVLVPGGGVADWKGQATDPMGVLASQGIKPAPSNAPGETPANAPLDALGDLAPLTGAVPNGAAV